MQVNVQKFLEDAGIKEAFYPGKRIIVPCRQSGEGKSHVVLLDWRNPDKIRIEVKPGLSGKTLEPAVLKKYPVSFQTPTFVEIEVVNDNDDEEEKGETSSGKSSSGGGKQPAKDKDEKLSGLKEMASAFGEVVEGKIPDLGKIKEIVVMGSQIAEDAFEKVFGELTKQIKHLKVSCTSLLAQAGSLLTKVAPPSFMEPKGDETVKYDYDAEKNADIGFRLSLS